MSDLDFIQYEKDQLDKAVKWMDENFDTVPHAVVSVYRDGVKWRKEYIARLEKREEENKID